MKERSSNQDLRRGAPAESRHRRRTGLAAALAPACLALTIHAAPAAAADGIDPEAARLLQRMTGFLGDQQRFSLQTTNTVEVVLEDGQKIQFTGTARTSVQRPDRLHSERIGDVLAQSLVYDGSTLTLSNPDDGYYATVDAPPTLDGMLDFARDVLDVVAPAGDLITRDAYGRLVADSRSGFVVGKSWVGGVRCDHLAFRGYGVDWQVWIEDGDRPLPRKYVITTLDVDGAPQAEILVTEWNLSPTFGEEQFRFTPANGATRIDFITLHGAGGQP